uniref:Integrase catalytic domain-containing protein n=1 Tax=Astyanax mexicanus TaxID=7994 RepID=A0A8B9JGI8_ASTMX
MQDDITDLVNRCNECQIHGAKKPRPPERQISTTRPMEVLGCNLMDFQGLPILVSIDYLSGYVFIDPLRSSATSVVTARLNDNFWRFGLPEKIISDNGPCFRSEQFQKYCELFEIHQTTTSPYHHQSNGRVERAIQTVRSILKKCKTDADITLAILAYLHTPISADLPSPAELFLSRQAQPHRQESSPSETSTCPTGTLRTTAAYLVHRGLLIRVESSMYQLFLKVDSGSSPFLRLHCKLIYRTEYSDAAKKKKKKSIFGSMFFCFFAFEKIYCTTKHH